MPEKVIIKSKKQTLNYRGAAERAFGRKILPPRCVKIRELKKLSEKAKKKKEGSGLFGPLAMFAAFILVVYSIITIISQQVQIAQLKQQKSEINAQMNEARQLNDEYTRLLASEDESEYMERIAVEKLGYAYPNERRFYVVDAQ